MSDHIQRAKEGLQNVRCNNCDNEVFNQKKDGLVDYGKPYICEKCGLTIVLTPPYDINAFLDKRKKERELTI